MFFIKEFTHATEQCHLLFAAEFKVPWLTVTLVRKIRFTEMQKLNIATAVCCAYV